MRYYEGENTGKGFITHEDSEVGHIAGYPADIWVTENWRWAALKGLNELSKEQAQRKIDLFLYGEEDEEGNPLVINLP